MACEVLRKSPTRLHFSYRGKSGRRCQRLHPESGLLEPVPVEVFSPLHDARHDSNIDRRLPGKHKQRLQDGSVVAAARDKGLADPSQNVGAITQELARLSEISAAEILEHNREIVGQLARRQIKSRPLVEILEVDHRLAAIAPLAVQMLKQMQRYRTATIEEFDVALFGFQMVAAADI